LSPESDLGGSDQLNAIEHALVEGFAGAAVTLQHLNTQLALGQLAAQDDREARYCEYPSPADATG
jgi:hypothetical protein